MVAACGGGDGAPVTASGGAAGGGSGGAGAASAGSSLGGGKVDDDPDPVLDEQTLERLRELAPARLPAAPADPSNAWADDPAAAAFGQALFFDPRFSGTLLDGDNDGSVNALGRKGDSGKVSCAGCHLPSAEFSDTRTIRRQISLAAGWGMRKSPSLLDVGQSHLLMWDGRRDSFFSQAFGVLENPVEMNSSRLYAAHQVYAHHKATYEAIFGELPPLDDAQRFPVLAPDQVGCVSLDRVNQCTSVMRGSPGDGGVYDAMATADQDAVTRVWANVGKALGAYQRLLSCGPGRFDQWMHGEASALTRAEQRGAALFAGKAACVACHAGPFLSDEKFHNVGVQPQLVATVFIDADDHGASVGLAALKADPLNVQGSFSDGDDGRVPAEVPVDAVGAFRTPRLRCVSARPAFMHTGHMGSLEEVVEFFDRGGDSFGFPGTSKLRPLGLSARERSDLVAFLRTLDGPGPDEALLTPIVP